MICINELHPEFIQFKCHKRQCKVLIKMILISREFVIRSIACHFFVSPNTSLATAREKQKYQQSGLSIFYVVLTGTWNQTDQQQKKNVHHKCLFVPLSLSLSLQSVHTTFFSLYLYSFKCICMRADCHTVFETMMAMMMLIDLLPFILNC